MALLAVDDDIGVAQPDYAIDRSLDRGLFVDRGGAANVEGAHGQLGARLANRLGGDHTNRLTQVHRCAAGQVAPITFGAGATLGFAGQHRANLDLRDAGGFNGGHLVLVQRRTALDDGLLGDGILDRHRRRPAENALAQIDDNLAALHHLANGNAGLGLAVFFNDHAILADIDQATGQITRVRGLQGGIGQALAGAMGRVEILEHAQAFLEVRDNRRLDDLARGLGHQATHARQLLHLGGGTTGAGMGHHVDRVDLRFAPGLRVHGMGRNSLHHLVGDLVGALRPGINNLVVLLALGNQADLILLFIFLHQAEGFLDQLVLGFRNDHVILAKRNTGHAGMFEAQRHDPVGKQHRLFLTAEAIDDVENLGDFFLGQQAIDNVKADIGISRQELGKQHAARSGLHPHTQGLALLVNTLVTRDNLGMQRHRTNVQGQLNLVQIGEGHACAGLAFTVHGQVIQPQHDILAGHDDRLAVGRAEDVVGRHHQNAGLELGLQRKRYMHRHLIAVEVGVEGGTDQRMKLDRLALDQHRLKGLDAQAMQRRRPVQQNRMLADHLIQDIPDFAALLLDQLFRLFDCGGDAQAVKARINERLEQLQRHFLRQTALVQLQLRPDHDDRAARIVDALAQQVLAEAALLALEHVREGLQRALVGAGNGAATPAVVEQRIDCLLQHALLVTHDNVGGAQLDQPFQAIVTVDNPAIQIVQVRGRETPAIQGHQRPQLGRNDRHHVQDHPFGTVRRADKGLDHLQPFDDLLGLQLGLGLGQLDQKLLALAFQIDLGQELLDRLGANFSGKAVVAEFVLGAHIVFFGEKLILLQRGQTGFDNHEAFKIQNPLQILQRHVQQQANAAGQRLEEPDMGDRRGQLDMTHTVAPHLRLGNFNAAFLAGDALVLHALVLAAQAFVILGRAKDTGAEQAVPLRLEGAVIDRLGLLDLAKGP